MYRPYAPFIGAVSTTACSGRWFVIHGSNFYIGASVAIRTFTLVARACFNTLVIGVIVIIRMLKKVVFSITVASLCLLIILLNAVTPTSIGPFGVLAVFAFAYLSLLGVMTFFVFYISRIVTHLSAAFTVKKPIQALSFKKSYYYSTIIAAAPIMLIGLQSVGSIGFYELLLVAIFVIIGCVYITKRTH